MVITSDTPIVDGAMLTIPRKARHEIMRVDRPGLKGHQKAAQDAFRRLLKAEVWERMSKEDGLVEESTRPDDKEKQVFFRQLASAASEPRNSFSPLTPLHIFTIMSEMDTKPVFLDFGARGKDEWRNQAEETVTWFFLGIARLLGSSLGLQPVTPEYTPKAIIGSYHNKKWVLDGR